ncbi:MAG: cation:proton antiporter [Legionella sp.]|nr:cation:proton antiporter [Legionella sp.]
MRNLRACLLLAGAIPLLAMASSGSTHTDPVTSVILVVTTLLFFSIMGRYIARCLNQPGVLGELLMGIFIGNCFYFFHSHLIIILREGSSIFDVVGNMLGGVPLKEAVTKVISNQHYAQQVIQALSGHQGTELIKIAYVVDIFSRYGVIFLLFMVGLESSVEELKHTGKESVIVALLGVIAPMLLGFGIAYVLMPTSSYVVDLFIAATLSATSIGITARVLSEMKKLRTREARTILGAAMLDDILGLIILAVVSSVVLSGSVDLFVVCRIIVYSLVFFTTVLYFGPIIISKAIHFFRFLEPWEAKLFISFIFVMALSWLASIIQLSTIIGAFAAGVILHDGYFKSYEAYEKNRTIQDLVAPIESILAPMFFMVIGLQVKLETFYNWEVIVLAGGLTFAAILGKLLSGFGANAKDDRLLVGIGMLPRGEVGLVFASIGRTLGVISDNLFSAIIIMVIITTVMTPPLLKIRYARKKEST